MVLIENEEPSLYCSLAILANLGVLAVCPIRRSLWGSGTRDDVQLNLNHVAEKVRVIRLAEVHAKVFPIDCGLAVAPRVVLPVLASRLIPLMVNGRAISFATPRIVKVP